MRINIFLLVVILLLITGGSISTTLVLENEFSLSLGFVTSIILYIGVLGLSFFVWYGRVRPVIIANTLFFLSFSLVPYINTFHNYIFWGGSVVLCLSVILACTIYVWLIEAERDRRKIKNNKLFVE